MANVYCSSWIIRQLTSTFHFYPTVSLLHIILSLGNKDSNIAIIQLRFKHDESYYLLGYCIKFLYTRGLFVFAAIVLFLCKINYILMIYIKYHLHIPIYLYCALQPFDFLFTYLFFINTF